MLLGFIIERFPFSHSIISDKNAVKREVTGTRLLKNINYFSVKEQKGKDMLSDMPSMSTVITFSPMVFKSQRFSMIAYTSFSSPVSLHNNLTLVELCLPYHYLNSAGIYQTRVVCVMAETL